MTTLLLTSAITNINRTPAILVEQLVSEKAQYIMMAFIKSSKTPEKILAA